MKMRFFLIGLISNALFGLTPVAVAHGGSGGGTGHGGGAWAGRGGGAWAGHRGGTWAGRGGGAWAGRGGGAWAGHRGGAWAGHGRVAWGGHGHGFHRTGRFFSSGYGFYGLGYPWWWNYPGYSYYPDPSPYYGYDDPYDGGAYDGNTYYGNPYYGNGDPRSSATKALQAALARRGYYRGRVDGVLGPQTRNAIRSFQAHQGLPVTGQVDARLIRALES
jgi:hypothetical protein